MTMSTFAVGAATTSSVRHSNLALVANAIFGAPNGVTRADVSTQTGLTRATVSRLVAELIDLELVVEAPLAEGGKRGRPGTPLVPAGGTMVALGMEVNVDRVAGYALDLRRNIIDGFSRSISVKEFTPTLPLEILKKEGAELLARLRASDVGRILSVHVAVPGVVDIGTNAVTYAPNVRWRNLDLHSELSEMLGGVPLYADNDAKMQASFEVERFGSLTKQPGTFLYISGDIGIGGAILSDGRTVQGLHGWAGEIGHMTIETDGPPCHCGSRGCLERYAGQREILIAAGLPLDTTPEVVAEKLAAGDVPTLAAVQRAGKALGIAIANVVNLLDIGDVVLGTALAPLVSWLLPSLRSELDERILARAADDVGLYAASEEPHPASVGGALRGLNLAINAPATVLA